jgi:hypothetical protein
MISGLPKTKRREGTPQARKRQDWGLTSRRIIRRTLRPSIDRELFTLMINRPGDRIHKDQTEPIPYHPPQPCGSIEVDPQFSAELPFTRPRGELF